MRTLAEVLMVDMLFGRVGVLIWLALDLAVATSGFIYCVGRRRSAQVDND